MALKLVIVGREAWKWLFILEVKYENIFQNGDLVEGMTLERMKIWKCLFKWSNYKVMEWMCALMRSTEQK